MFGRLFGFVLIYPRDFDQIQHFAHHRYTQDWEGDGELARERYTLASYLLWVLGPTYWYTRVRRVIRFAFGVVTEPYIPDDRKAEVIREARWHLAGYAADRRRLGRHRQLGGGAAVAAPMLAMKPVHQLQNTIEHLGLPHVARHHREHAHDPHQCADALAGVEHAISHRPSRLSRACPATRCRSCTTRSSSPRGRKPPTMSYLAFQWAVLRAFWNGRTEADYPDDAIWISDDTDLEPVAPRVRPAKQA